MQYFKHLTQREKSTRGYSLKVTQLRGEKYGLGNLASNTSRE